MIDWEELLRTEDHEELRNAKLWLFRENMRLERERTLQEQEAARLEQERLQLDESKDKFIKERVLLKNELDELNRRTVMERKRLKEENLFFDKKMAILQDGFRQLEEDRRNLEREKLKLEMEREGIASASVSGLLGDGSVAAVLFRNVNNPLALRKRYRDLVKIFHPDNLAGDEELVQLINKEFARRRREE